MRSAQERHQGRRPRKTSSSITATSAPAPKRRSTTARWPRWLAHRNASSCAACTSEPATSSSARSQRWAGAIYIASSTTFLSETGIVWQHPARVLCPKIPAHLLVRVYRLLGWVSAASERILTMGLPWYYRVQSCCEYIHSFQTCHWVVPGTALGSWHCADEVLHFINTFSHFTSGVYKSTQGVSGQGRSIRVRPIDISHRSTHTSRRSSPNPPIPTNRWIHVHAPHAAAPGMMPATASSPVRPDVAKRHDVHFRDRGP